MTIREWKLLGKRTVFDRPHGVVEVWNMRLPNGKRRPFTMLRGYDFVKVCGLSADGKVILIRQFYMDVQKRIVSLVAGYRDKGESPLQAAKREFLEETGYAARRWVALGKSIKGKYMTGEVYHFLAIGAKKVREQNLEPAEDIEVAEMPLSKFKTLIEEKKMMDVFAEVCGRRAIDFLMKNK